MTDPMLHHVSLATTNLERSHAFYRDVLGLRRIDRPAFPVGGIWLTLGGAEIHLIDKPSGNFRSDRTIDTAETHFAVRVADFEATILRLTQMGYREDADQNDPLRIVIIRSGVAGYPQAYVLDPDAHIVEINAAA